MPKRKQGSSALAELHKNRDKQHKLKKKKLKVKKKDRPRKIVNKAKAKRVQERARQESAAASARSAVNLSQSMVIRDQDDFTQMPAAHSAEEIQRLKQLASLARLTLGAQVHKSLPLCHAIAGRLPVDKRSPTMTASAPLSSAAFAILRDGLLATTPGFGRPQSQHASALQPYLNFCQEQRAKLSAGSSAKLGNSELARRWKALDDGVREGYKDEGGCGTKSGRTRVRITATAALEKFLGPGSVRRASSGFRSFAGQVAVCSVVQLPCTIEFLPAKPSGHEATFDDNDKEHDAEDAEEPGQLMLRYTYAFEMKMPTPQPPSDHQSNRSSGNEGGSSGAAGGPGGGSSDTCMGLPSTGKEQSQDY